MLNIVWITPIEKKKQKKDILLFMSLSDSQKVTGFDSIKP